MPKKNRSKFNKKSQVHQSEENENFSEIIEEEKSNNIKGNNQTKKINKDNPEKKFLNNNHDLSQLDYYEKPITGDGNCYYRCLSYYYRGTEDYHLEFR